MSLSESLYLQLPYRLKVLALNGYSIYQRYRNYGGEFLDYQHDQRCLNALDREGVYQWQAKALLEVIKFARANTRFYNGALKNLGDVDEENVWKYLFNEVPIISKESIRERTSDFCVNNKNNTFPIFTSGTSGTPLKVLTSKKSRRKNYSFYADMLERNGVTYKSLGAIFAGRNIVSLKDSKPYIQDHYSNKIYYSSFHINKNNIALYVSSLNKYKPQYIDSYPSSLYSLVKLAEDHGLQLIYKPKLIITSSEKLLEKQRISIEGYFNCKVVDYYGNTEMAAFIEQQLDSRRYIANPFYSYVELVDKQGNHLVKSGTGEIVSTSFINYEMPLLRYRLEDEVLVSTVSKYKSARYYSIDEILGRTEDIIIGFYGQRVGRLDPIMKGVEGVRYAQLVQHRKGTLDVYIELEGKAQSADVIEIIRSNLANRVGPLIFSFHFVEHIKREKSGKIKFVISKL